MIPKLLLLILLQLTLLKKTASGAPCTLKFLLGITRTPGSDEHSGTIFEHQSEIKPYYRIKRLSDGEKILEGDPGKKTRNNRQGDCSWTDRYVDVPFNETKTMDNCEGEFELFTNGWEIDYGSGNDRVWEFTRKFQCDGKELLEKQCTNDDGGAEVKLKCTKNDGAWDIVIPALIKDLEQALNKKQFDKLYQMFDNALNRLIRAGLGYKEEIISKCKTWNDYPSCRIVFFKPIIGVIASYRKKTEGQSDIEQGKEIDSWSTLHWIDRNEWKQAPEDIAKMMKNALTKYPDDSNIANILKREMFYTKLHRMNEPLFPWKESIVNKLAKEKWESYARSANDQELRKILDFEMDEDVQKFCNEETGKSPLCSFVAAKNKYDKSLLHFPKPCANAVATLSDQLKSKCSNIISIQAYYGKNGQYTTFYEKLNEFLRDTEIKNAIGNLGEKLKIYFTELAKFDNSIAQADVGYLQSAMQKNTDRLKTSIGQIKQLTAEIKELKTICAALNLIEQVLMLAVSIGIAVASGGAVPPNPETIKDSIDAAKDVIDAAKDGITMINTMVRESISSKDLQELMGDAPSMMEKIVDSLAKNKEKIDGMHMIVKAALNPDKSNLAAIRGPVHEFLKSYSDYTPGVTKADIAVLNKKYGDMLENFKKSFEGAGFLCGISGVSGQAAAKLGEAETVWVAINSLLEDIYGQQFELITALVKVIRSKLDQSAAKQLEADVNYNFEYIVGNMLTVRVAAQQVCDTYRYINNDVQDNEHCKDMSNQVFLESLTRDRIKELDNHLLSVLKSYAANPSIAWIPVHENHTKDAIRWDDLISGKVVEYTLPANNKFLNDYGWNPAPDKRMILPSFEPFIPDNVVTTRSNVQVFVRFNVSAIQEIVTVNRNPNAQLYAIKSDYPLSVRPEYTLNNPTCQAPKLENLFPHDPTLSSKYCIPASNGNFGNGVDPAVPVSMYSTFRIQLIDGQLSDPDAIKNSRPVGDTLKIPVRIQVFDRGQGRQRTQKPKISNLPMTEPCPEGQYRRIIDAKTQKCEPCPAGSVPKGQGSYCVRVAQ
jgi:hypothetical protein